MQRNAALHFILSFLFIILQAVFRENAKSIQKAFALADCGARFARVDSGGEGHVPVLTRRYRRYDFESDLEKALNRVDFFRIFHTMSLRYDFEHFGVLQLANEHETSMLSSRLVLHDLPAGLAEAYDKRHRLNDSETFKSFYRSTISTVWRTDDNVDDTSPGGGSSFLDQLGFDMALCVPVHAITGLRFVVIFLGDGDDIGQNEHYQICYEANCAFDYFYRKVLSNKAGMGLTPRETEILRWISYGKTASEIALIVSVSEHTVNSHTATILKKLDVVNRTQMVAKAIREQIIQ
jgi:DNA-binding CsgD family transcriptional regulator